MTISIIMTEFSLTGLSRGGQQVQKARETYTKALNALVELASLQVRKACETGTKVLSLTAIYFYDNADCIRDPRRGHPYDQPQSQRN